MRLKHLLNQAKGVTLIYINDELVGELKFLERDGMKSQTFEPLKTKYGVVRMVNKINGLLLILNFPMIFI